MAAASGLYNLIRPSTATSTSITLQQVTGVAASAEEFTRGWANQASVTATAQGNVKILRKSSAATVTSTNPNPVGNGMQASKCVGGATATGLTATIEGTDASVLVDEGFNIVNGWLYLPVPEERKIMVGADSIALKMATLPATANFVSGLEWLEYAG